MPTHDQDIFYNKVTHDIYNYAQLKALAPVSWPASYTASGVDSRIADTNPPNSFLPTYPFLANWERLYRDSEPSVKMWEIAELNAPYQDTAGFWIQSWTVRARTTEEMGSVFINVSNTLSSLKDGKLGQEVSFTNENDSVFVSDSTKEAIDNLGSLIDHVVSGGLEPIDWKGKRDPETNLPRYADARISDLEELLVACVTSQQKAFKAERQTFIDYQENYSLGDFDSMGDVTDKFNENYESLFES